MDALRRRLRLAYVDGAEHWTLENVGRPMTGNELVGVIGRCRGTWALGRRSTRVLRFAHMPGDQPSPAKPSLDDIRSVLDKDIFPALDAPIRYFSDEALQAIEIGRRGRDLYRAIGAIESLHPTAALILARAVTEVAILAGWVEQKPSEHLELWRAEADRVTLASLGRFNRYLGRMGADAPRTDRNQNALARKRVAEARATAKGLGHPERSSLLPSLEEMAAGDADVWDGYQLIYRMLSHEIHSAAGALGTPRLENRRDGTHLVSGESWPSGTAIQMATPQVVNLMVSVSRLGHLGLHDRLTTLWDAYNPPRPRMSHDPERIGRIRTP